MRLFWRIGGAVERTCFENRRTARFREFESLILRETAGSSWRFYQGLAGVP